MDSFGDKIRKLREDNDLPLRVVTSFLEMDQAILSKIERGQRKATREQVINLSKFYKTDENELLIAWLSDKLVYEVRDEEVALKAMQVAEKKINYIIKNKNGKY